MVCIDSSREKKYAHYLGEASWAGARIIVGQWTPYNEKLYDLVILTFSENGTITDTNALKAKSGLSDDEWDRLLEFASQASDLSDISSSSSTSSIDDVLQALSNLANYKSFGFTKFVPRISQAKFSAVVENSPNAANAIPVWNEVRNLPIIVIIVMYHVSEMSTANKP